MKPYTYLIGWPELDRWYYGVRYAGDCDPSDFWNPYKTSSRSVKSFIQEHGDPSVKLIRKTFDNQECARLWENRVLKRMKVVNDDKWLNKTDNVVFEPLYGDDNPMRRDEVRRKFQGSNHPNKKIENRKKISVGHLKKGDQHHTKKSEVRNKIKTTMLAMGDNHPMRQPERSGQNHAMKRPENRRKAKLNNTGSRNPMFGKKHKRIMCAHCGKNVSVNSYPVWHGDKCKMNLSKIVGNTRQRSV